MEQQQNNIVYLKGFLASNPKPNKTMVTLSVVTEHFDGRTYLSYHRVVVFGVEATKLLGLIKGTELQINGMLKTRKYNDRYFTEVVLNDYFGEIDIVNPVEAKQVSATQVDSIVDDDIPF